MVVIGVDGGGSKTKAAVAKKTGEVIGTSENGPSRLHLEKAKKVIEGVVKDALKQAGKSIGDVEYAFFGLGGVDTEKSKKKAMKMVREIVQVSRFSVVTDGMVGLYSGTFGDPGIVIISGTGALLQGINERGQSGRVDGWGHLFGDLGSAYYIGREGIKAILEQFDGRGRETLITQKVLERFNIEKPPKLLDHFGSVEYVPSEVASIAPLVDEAAERGDKIARNSLKDAAKELERSTETLLARLNMKKLDPLFIVLIGGVFESDIVEEALKNRLDNRHSKIEFKKPSWDPVVGALVMGLKKSGIEIDSEVARNLKKIDKEMK